MDDDTLYFPDSDQEREVLRRRGILKFREWKVHKHKKGK